MQRSCRPELPPSNGGSAQGAVADTPALTGSATTNTAATPPASPLACPALQSYGRSQERNATCKTYIAADAGCGASWPTLAGGPSADTKWIFDPVPGGSIYRWYIRMNVRAAAEAERHSCFLAAACWLVGFEDLCSMCVDTLCMLAGLQPQSTPCTQIWTLYLPSPPPQTPVQARVAAGCRRDYMGMNRNVCEEKTTQLYLPQNATASRVWLVEPLVPGPPTITAAAVAGGLQTGILVVTLTPPAFAGYFAISSYTLNCAPAKGPTITVVGLGRNVGGQVRAGAIGAGSPLQRPAHACSSGSGLHAVVLLLTCRLPQDPAPTHLLSSPPPLLLQQILQKKFDYQPGEHQTGMTYTCRAFASNAAGAGPRSAPFTFTIAG